MHQHHIEFKKCRPGDVETAIPLILSSGPDAFAYVFSDGNKKASDFLRFAFLRQGGEFSFDNHYAIWLDGALVGIGSVFDARVARRFFIRDILNIIRYYHWKAIPVLIRGYQTEQIILLPKENEICIAHLGISPNHQGKGLGRQLIDFLMREATPDSKHSFILDVSEENPRAKALYERLGFRASRHMHSRLKNKQGYVPSHFRMELVEE